MSETQNPNPERFHWWNAIQAQLTVPFPAELVNWKPQKTWNAENWDDRDKRKHTSALAVAYVVARHFGLNHLNSPNYVALHGADAAAILEHLTRIQATAAEIITGLEGVNP